MPDSPITNFLFQGSPPPSVTTYSSTTASLPPWFEAYQQALLNRSNAVAGRAYQGFEAPDQAHYAALEQARLAPFSDATQQSWDMGAQAAGSHQAPLDNALVATTNSLSNGGYGAAHTGLAAPQTMQSGLAVAQPQINAATSISGLSTAQPYTAAGLGALTGLEAATPGLNASTNMSGANTAQPYTDGALNMTTGATVANGALGQALTTSGANAAAPTIQGALSAPTALDIANPLFGQAAGMSGAGAAN